jgi:hypothetical protein
MPDVASVGMASLQSHHVASKSNLMVPVFNVYTYFAAVYFSSAHPVYFFFEWRGATAGSTAQGTYGATMDA